MTNINIQILRGVSVLLVLFFHLDVVAFSFGYIGVDMFFLISGFLMPIILPKYDGWGFIKARLNRLLPALSVLVLAALVMGYFFQLPGEYFNLALSSLGAVTFLSQFYFISNTGYFDQNSILQPLLHTWSLGNEFLAYVLVFFAVLVLPRSRLKIFAILIVFLSVLYVIVSLSVFSVNYLDPIPRIYLFFLGFLVSAERYRLNIDDKFYWLVSISSLVLIVVLYGEDIFLKSWPNYSIILFPCVLLPLMLMKGAITPSRHLNGMLQKLGDWSYSIYIWHWLIISFERIYFRNLHLNYREVLLLFVVSIGLGAFSHIYIERNKLLGRISLALCLVMITGVLISSGASYRTPASLKNYAAIELMTDSDYFTSLEVVNGVEVFKVSAGERSSKTVIIGDSHSRHILPIYKAGYHGSIFRVSLGLHDVNDQWDAVTQMLATLDIDTVIFSYRLHTKKSSDIESLTQIINDPEFNQNYRSIILRDVPSFDGDPVSCLFANESDLMFKGCGFDVRGGFPVNKVYNAVNLSWDLLVGQASGDNQLIDTHKSLCDSARCLTSVNKEFIYRDGNHLNEKLSNDSNKILYGLIFSSLK